MGLIQFWYLPSTMKIVGFSGRSETSDLADVWLSGMAGKVRLEDRSTQGDCAFYMKKFETTFQRTSSATLTFGGYEYSFVRLPTGPVPTKNMKLDATYQCRKSMETFTSISRPTRTKEYRKRKRTR